jgi:hypothetical protein
MLHRKDEKQRESPPWRNACEGLRSVIDSATEIEYVSNHLFSTNVEDPSRFVDPLRAMLGVGFSF